MARPKCLRDGRARRVCGRRCVEQFESLDLGWIQKQDRHRRTRPISFKHRFHDALHGPLSPSEVEEREGHARRPRASTWRSNFLNVPRATPPIQTPTRLTHALLRLRPKLVDKTVSIETGTHTSRPCPRGGKATGWWHIPGQPLHLGYTYKYLG